MERVTILPKSTTSARATAFCLPAAAWARAKSTNASNFALTSSRAMVFRSFCCPEILVPGYTMRPNIGNAKTPPRPAPCTIRRPADPLSAGWEKL